MSVDYGPLQGLIGIWQGDKGLDISSEPDGSKEESPYYDTLECIAAGDVENYEEQKLAIVRYHQVVTRKSNDEVFHDQVGYWLWDASSQTDADADDSARRVRDGGGTATGSGPVVLQVRAALGDPDWPVAQSPFMRDRASTKAFEHEVTLDGDRLRYAETTTLDIFGIESFAHTDANERVRKG